MEPGLRDSGVERETAGDRSQRAPQAEADISRHPAVSASRPHLLSGGSGYCGSRSAAYEEVADGVGPSAISGRARGGIRIARPPKSDLAFFFEVFVLGRTQT